MQNASISAPSAFERPLLHSILVAALLIAASAGARLLELPPNFQVVGAVALFAGFYFARSRAWLVPMAAMLVSNMFIGGYDLTTMAIVNVAILLPAFFGYLLRKPVEISERFQRFARLLRPVIHVARVAALSIAGSLAFFLISNLAVWAFSGMYGHSLEGLLTCYLVAVPFIAQDQSMRFLGATVLGDLFFNALFFGAYALAASVASRSAHREDLAPATVPAKRV